MSIIHTKEFPKICNNLEKTWKRSICYCSYWQRNLRGTVAQPDRQGKEAEINDDRIQPFLPAIMESIANIDHIQPIKKFKVIEFNRFLDYYKDAVDITCLINNRKSKEAKEVSCYVKFL
ncbi:MAG: hypothetical protein IPP37_14230 [Saprospiraceae bacterium]|nr:hypothetical protein [Saprospiraceae bacterium]